MPTRQQFGSVALVSSPATLSSFAVGSGSDRSLVALIGGRNDTNPIDVDSIVFNTSESFTYRGEAWYDQFTNQKIEIWTLDNPSNTTANVVASWSTGTMNYGMLYVVEYTGANNGIGSTVGTLADTTSNLYIDLTTDASGNTLVAMLSTQVTDGWPLTAESGTDILDESAAQRTALFEFDPSTGGTDRIGATAGTGRRSAMVAIELLAAGGGAAPPGWDKGHILGRQVLMPRSRM